MNVEKRVTTVKKEYAAVDITKFIMSIMVLLLHESFLYDINPNAGIVVCNSFARLAVPYFFVAGSYFLFLKSNPFETNKKKISDYVVRMLILYIIWVLIYIYPIMQVYGRDIKAILRRMTLSSYGHLWYLKGMAVAVAMVGFLLLIKVKPFIILLLSAGVYAFGTLFEGYYRLMALFSYTKIWGYMQVYLTYFKTTQNGVFFGFFFVAMGMWFAYSGIKLPKKISVAGLGLSVAMLCCETQIITKRLWLHDYNLMFSLAPRTFFLFALTLDINIKPSKTTRLMRKYSSLTYFIHYGIHHPGMIYICSRLTVLTGKEVAFNSIERAIIVYTITMIISTAVLVLEKNRYFTWIKKLH